MSLLWFGRSDSTTSRVEGHFARVKSCGVIVALCILFLALSAPALGATTNVDVSPNPKWCPEGYRCLTAAEYTQMAVAKVRMDDEIRRLKGQRLFHQLGVEYLPGETHATPYGLMGLRFGPITTWGGFFGDRSAVGIGYQW